LVHKADIALLKGLDVHTIILVLGIWLVLSIPMSVVLGSIMRDDRVVDLVGMDGDAALFRRADGTLVRRPLVDHALR
jgi:hypothetical protein